MNLVSLMGLGAFVILVSNVQRALRLIPSHVAKRKCATLIMSAVWGATGLLCSWIYSIEARFQVYFYLVFFLGGYVAGLQTVTNLAYLLRSKINANTAFLLILPMNVIIGILLYGTGGSLIVFGILRRLQAISLNAEVVVRFGILVGGLASVAAYIVWRIVIRRVWR